MARIKDTDRVPAEPPVEGEINARVIVASARRIDLTDKKAVKRAMKARQQWQTDAWLVFDAIGEVKYADRFLANACGRLRLYPAVQLEADQPPTPLDASTFPDAIKAAAQDVLHRLRAEVGGQSMIMRLVALNLEVAGECFLLGYDPVEEQRDAEGTVTVEARDERWEVRSISEVQVSGEGIVKVRTVPGAQPEAVPPGTFLLRIWEAHPEYQELPDSPLHGVLAECDELLILSRSIRAQGRSRIPAGLLLVPTELSFGAPDPTQPDAKDVFSEKLMEALMNAVEDESDPSALVPPVIRGKSEHLKELRHVLMDRPIDVVAAGQRKELLQRIAQGLNVPPEVILGMSSANHWTAWQVDASTFSAHIEPRAIGICDALTAGVFRVLLKAYAGVDAELADKVFIWYDESEVVTSPNRAQDAKDAHAANAISDEALRKALGFSDIEAPTAEELARRTGLDRGKIDPAITEQLLSYLLGQQFIDAVGVIRADQSISVAPTSSGGGAPGAAPDTSANGAPPGDGTDQAVAAAGNRTPVGHRLARIDTELVTRLRIASDSALTRALDKAGARLRSKTSTIASARRAVNGVDNRLVPATLGPAMVASLETTDAELLAGAFDSLHAQWEAWVAGAQEQALSIAAATWGVPDDRRATLEQSMVNDRDEAWTWLLGALTDLAHRRLYDPAPVVAAARTTATLIGEQDPSLSVPASMIREATARAGGATGMTVQRTNAGGVRLSTQAGTIPAGGVATGQTIVGLAADQGFPVDWYEWQHGAPAHPFEPHLQLDGVTFYGEDDPNVANDEGWPDTPYFFPGDHDGCTCFSVPVFGAGPDRTTGGTIG